MKCDTCKGDFSIWTELHQNGRYCYTEYATKNGESEFRFQRNMMVCDSCLKHEQECELWKDIQISLDAIVSDARKGLYIEPRRLVVLGLPLNAVQSAAPSIQLRRKPTSHPSQSMRGI